MKLLRLETRNPYWNLAVEEFLFRCANESILLLWQNDPTVVIGRNQNAYAELDLAYARENGIAVARRITGGGAVYHDAGNLNYSFLAPQSAQSGTDFDTFTKPMRDALQALGVRAVLSGRNDLEVDGKKISGSAQHTANGRVLHHGTLLFDSDLEMLSRVLRVNADKLASKAIPSVRARVTNLRPLLPSIADVDTLSRRIGAFWKERYGAEEIELLKDAEIERLYERNRSQEWLFPKRELLSSYTVTRQRRYPFGTVEVCLDMDGERIRKVCIRGDFFGHLPIEELENRLTGKTMAEAEREIRESKTEGYISGMRSEILAKLLLGTDD